VTIKRYQWGWQEVVIGFHRLHGFQGGILYLIWAFFVDIISLAMIIFGITGIFMWYKSTKKRVWGWLLLSVTYIYCFATVLYLQYAP
jgi:hypothetical protein